MCSFYLLRLFKETRTAHEINNKNTRLKAVDGCKKTFKFKLLNTSLFLLQLQDLCHDPSPEQLLTQTSSGLSFTFNRRLRQGEKGRKRGEGEQEGEHRSNILS